MKTKTIKLIAKVPHNCSEEHLAAYVAIALRKWGAGSHPDDPLFDGIRVKQVSIAGNKYAPQESGGEDDVQKNKEE